MNAVRDATIAARVPVDLREALEEVTRRRAAAGDTRSDGAPIDLSTVIRGALREYADHALGSTSTLAGDDALGAPPRHRPSLLDDGTPGATRRGSGPTEVAASLKVAGKIGTHRRRALELLEAAGNRGLTPDEVHAALEPAPQNSVARRVTDLLQGGLIEPRTELYGLAGLEERLLAHGEAMATQAVEALAADGHQVDGVVVRPTRAGAWGTVYRISGAGLLALTDKRKQEA